MLALAEQYLAFIKSARAKRLEVAADYLVMAAWLAFLKSRLLLPNASDDGVPAADDLAERLAFRLQRLQAMREAAARLMARNRLGRDVFQRGEPEPLKIETQIEYANNLIDLLKAYADRRKQRTRHQTYTVRKIKAWTIKEARTAIERLVGEMDDWGRLDHWLARYLGGRGIQHYSDRVELYRKPRACPRGIDRDQAGTRFRSHLPAAQTVSRVRGRIS